MVTKLDKELKRQVNVDGVDYTLSVGPEGFRLTAKGRRKPEVEMAWQGLLNGDAAMAVALNASLSTQRRVAGDPAAAPADRSRRRSKKAST